MKTFNRLNASNSPFVVVATAVDVVVLLGTTLDTVI